MLVGNSAWPTLNPPPTHPNTNGRTWHSEEVNKWGMHKRAVCPQYLYIAISGIIICKPTKAAHNGGRGEYGRNRGTFKLLSAAAADGRASIFNAFLSSYASHRRRGSFDRSASWGERTCHSFIERVREKREFCSARVCAILRVLVSSNWAVVMCECKYIVNIILLFRWTLGGLESQPASQQGV